MTRIHAKRKGARNELRTVRHLEALGYRCTKAGGSLGVWDIIAIGTAETLLVQVKSNRVPAPKERKAMREFAVPPHCHKRLLYVWHDYQRIPEIAEVTDTWN